MDRCCRKRVLRKTTAQYRFKIKRRYAILIQRKECPDSIISKFNSTVLSWILFRQHRSFTSFRLSARMSALPPIVLQKSPRRSCGIEIRNNRIGANEFLNRCCAFTLDLESILLARMRKIVLQHNPPNSDRITVAAIHDDRAFSPPSSAPLC